MRRLSASLALCVCAALSAACGGDNTNGTTNGNNGISESRPQLDKVEVTHPNSFLQGDRTDRGKVTFALEGVSEVVPRSSTRNANTTTTRAMTDTSIRPSKADADKYDVYVEVQLVTNGLTKIDPPGLGRRYTGSREVWEWTLKTAGDVTEGHRVSFQFRVDVKWQAKVPGVSDEVLSDVWKNEFWVDVGPPAWMVDTAFYGSPSLGVGGVFFSVNGIRKRRRSSGEASDEESDEARPGAAAEGPAPEAVEEEVSGTVYAPGQARPGDSFLVQVFVHLPEQAASLEEMAKEADEDARRRISSRLQKKIKRGAELTFHLVMPGLEVDAPTQSCVWRGEPERVQFGVVVPEDCRPRSLVGTVTVSENTVPIGHLKFTLKITADAAAAPGAPALEPTAAGELTRYRQAFISYASADRPEVLKRVQMLNLAKIKFFQDLLTLEPGDDWAKLLYDYIDKSDVFYLFWSKAASESEWVRREVEYAITRKGGREETGPEIIPVIIEGPPAARPPSELSFLHFNDKLIYFINPREAEARPPGA